MKHAALSWLVAALGVFPFISPTRALAQQFVVPRDGMFYVERKPGFTFKATLAEDWVNPHVADGTLHVFAPVLPELPGQGKVSTRLFISGNDSVKAEEIVEAGNKRPMLGLHIKSDALSPKSGIHLRLEYEGTLFARTLRRGKPPQVVADLSEEEQRQYLMSSATMDHSDPGFLGWMKEKGLNRRKAEQATQFAHRVFTHCVKNGTYGGDTSNYEARRPSKVCNTLTNDCGGLSLLFVAVMRANDVPARPLFGRWAIPQTDKYGQYHVMCEFFVPKSGWVPVDVSGTIVHKPKDPNAMFGNADGQFLTFHVDTDLEPAKECRHAWAQYLMMQWSGAGDFWREHRVDSKWDVARRPVKK